MESCSWSIAVVLGSVVYSGGTGGLPWKFEDSFMAAYSVSMVTLLVVAVAAVAPLAFAAPIFDLWNYDYYEDSNEQKTTSNPSPGNGGVTVNNNVIVNVGGSGTPGPGGEISTTAVSTSITQSGMPATGTTGSGTPGIGTTGNGMPASGTTGGGMPGTGTTGSGMPGAGSNGNGMPVTGSEMPVMMTTEMADDPMMA